METERIALSQRERDRLRVLHEAKRKQITQIEAARRLKISDRHIRRLLVRLGERGDRAVVHGLRGRPSNRRLAARLERKILRRVRQRYADHSIAVRVISVFGDRSKNVVSVLGFSRSWPTKTAQNPMFLRKRSVERPNPSVRNRMLGSLAADDGVA